MNYLDLVNNVLRRMRENTVVSLYQNEQSTVVADFINDARRQVEEAHDWSCLYTDLSINTVADTYEYELNGTDNRATVRDARNLTQGCWMTPTTTAYIRGQQLSDDPGTSAPSRYTLAGTSADGDAMVQVWPTPDGIYTLSFNVSLRGSDLLAEGDETPLPHMPIIHLAHAMAALERGAVDGADAQALASIAKKSLGDAIMYDMAKQPENNIWYPV